jgi:uncharacterized RDD family membrane protein YckC
MARGDPHTARSMREGGVWPCLDLPHIYGPWFVVGAIVFSLGAFLTLRDRRRMLRDGVVEDPASTGATSGAAPASPGLRIVGGLVDVIVIGVGWIIIGAFLTAIKDSKDAGLVDVLAVLAYFCYFWSARGQSIGMMVFGFRVRDMRNGRYPTPGRALLRAIIWSLEVLFTFLLVGAMGWLWQLWDPKQQAVHDKLAGTVVTAQ